MLPMRITPIIKLSETCCFTCEFCFYTHMKDKGNVFMDIGLCKKIIRESAEYNNANGVNYLQVIFHGGEPLLVGLDYMKEVLAYEKTLAENFANDFTFENSIQTNGYLLNDDWINFLVANDFNIGVSIDGDETMNFHYGPKGVKEATDTVLSNIHALASKNARFGILSVITNSHLGKTKQFYDFLVKNNIVNVGLCPCVNEDTKDTVNTSLLSEFMLEFFNLYFFGSYPLRVREFDMLIEKCLGSTRVKNCTACNRVNCGSYLAIDTLGNTFFCDSAYDKSTALGNIITQSFLEILSSEAFVSKKAQCDRFFTDKCATCEVLDLCAGGCHRNDVVVNGGATNLFCGMYKTVYPTIKEIVSINNQRR